MSAAPCSAPTGKDTSPPSPTSRGSLGALVPQSPSSSQRPARLGLHCREPPPGALLPPSTFPDRALYPALSCSSRQGKGRALTHCRSGTRAATGRHGQSEPGTAMPGDQQTADKRT